MRKCCSSCSLAQLAGGKGGREGRERAGGACSPSDRSLEEPGNPFFRLILTTCCVITDGSDLCALRFPFEKRKIMINIQVL